MNKLIPIFFSTDDNYIPFLDVAISSLIDNASKQFNYKIIILNTGLKEENIIKIKKNEQPCFSIEFFDISKSLANIEKHFKNKYHFSIASYYRFFIASLFPKYDKAIYLDCDIVVIADISKLYNIDIGDNILGVVYDQYVSTTNEFQLYVKNAIGVNTDTYFNSGVLSINLKEFRKNNIDIKFLNLISKYDFDLVDPDQAYLNYLCFEKTLGLPNPWNCVPANITCNDKNIIHYALYKKPWQEDDVNNGEYFWQYAKKSPFYNQILEIKNSFNDEDRKAKESLTKDILVHAKSIATSNYTFSKVLNKG